MLLIGFNTFYCTVRQWYQSRGFIPIEDCGKDYPGNIWMKANV